MSSEGLPRRSFLGLAGAGAVGLAAGVGGTVAIQAAADSESTEIGSKTVPFDGEHQAGIATPAPARIELAAFTLADGVNIGEVRALMQRWTPLAQSLTQGQASDLDPVPELAANPSSLTITVGFGPRFFDVISKPQDRPAGVADYPPFQGDELTEQFSGGDILIQARAEDSLAVTHAINALSANTDGVVVPKWRQVGFQRAAGVAPGETRRNLMGQKDGTANDPPSDPRFVSTVWASGGEYPQWYQGGTTLVLRRIKMDLVAWGKADQRTRERIMGRELDSGAPLGQTDEFDPVDLNAQGPDGKLQIPSSSHVRVAHPDSNKGSRMVRASYNYADGDESGLLFIAFQADATRGFIPVMSRMSVGDDLNRFVTHVGSAAFALPPGVQPGQYWGESLLA